MQANPGVPTKVDWYSLAPEAVAEKLGTSIEKGLDSAEAAKRLQQNGPNKLAATKAESKLHAFLRQYQDFMQIILLGAAIISFIATREVGTTVVLVLLTVMNALLGLQGESKAAASLAALETTLEQRARVRRDGVSQEIDAEEVVAGDIALYEAGDTVPADGRLITAATLEIEESALTGESTPTLKDIAVIEGTSVGLGDRHNLAFMNTSVTRGRGEMIVTDTGMATQMGHIADLLNKTESEKTPLQKQLDRLTVVIAAVAGMAFVLMLISGLIHGEDFAAIFTIGVSLAIGAIPCGLPAVITTLYSRGTRALADMHAIVKRLPSVETLGSVSAICSDKTGTLTLNKMTAREFVVPGRNRFKVTGEGYSTQGELLRDGGGAVDLDEVLMPMALCADARLDGNDLVGDPTEGALIVLAAKGGLDLDAVRARFPRIAEVPFDSDYKFMGTFHDMEDANGKKVVRCFVKGAPDVLIARGGSYWLPGGAVLPITDENRKLALDANDQFGEKGLRVMVVGRRDFDPATFDKDGKLIDLVNDITLLAMVGIVDPPRAEAKAAIEECKAAGIQVRMITGDHAVTAAAIGAELGITGEALSGAEFAALTDDELKARMPNIGVVARVAPEDKIRLVATLQSLGNIVSMTGDGVNDAPALKKADIGVAMGITGTDVSKNAAVMILTDDNFATIVKAVEYGRGLYGNLSKYIRFQMTALVTYIASFLGASVFAIAGGTPFQPLVTIYITLGIQVCLAIALGFDEPSPGLMQQKPRPIDQPVLSRVQWTRIVFFGVLQALAILLVLLRYEDDQNPYLAATMALTTFGLCLIAKALGARSETRSAFDPGMPIGRQQLLLYGAALLLILLGSELAVLNRVLETTPLDGGQWLACAGLAAALLGIEEVMKFFLRRQSQGGGEQTGAAAEPALAT